MAYWEFEDIQVYENSGRIVRAGRQLEKRLGPQPLTLLVYLLEHQHEDVVKRETLKKLLLWQDDPYLSNNRLNRVVSTVRKVLETDPIEVKPLIGYRFHGVARRIEPPTQVEAHRTKAKMRPADAYVHPEGRFEKCGSMWYEYGNEGPDKTPIYSFKEHWQDEDYIYMYDDTRRNKSGAPMYLRIPIRGGVIQWTFPNPMQWIDLLVVRPQKLKTRAARS